MFYIFKQGTNEFSHQTEGQKNPKIQGKFLKPPFATQTPPATTTENEAAIYNEADDTWQVVPDFRGYTGYDVDGNKQDINDLNIKPDATWTKNRPFVISEATTSKLNHINHSASTEILSGFTSNALGSEHYYQSSRDDQLNLIGLVASTGDLPMRCSVDGNTWSYIIHTQQQRQQVLDHGAAKKHTILLKAATLKALLATAKLESDLNKINW